MGPPTSIVPKSDRRKANTIGRSGVAHATATERASTSQSVVGITDPPPIEHLVAHSPTAYIPRQLPHSSTEQMSSLSSEPGPSTPGPSTQTKEAVNVMEDEAKRHRKQRKDLLRNLRVAFVW